MDGDISPKGAGKTIVVQKVRWHWRQFIKGSTLERVSNNSGGKRVVTATARKGQ